MNDTNASLLEILANDLDNTRSLRELLGAERRQLEMRKLDTLTDLLQEKSQLLAKIEANEQLRRDLLKTAGEPDSRDGFQRFLENLPEPMSSVCREGFSELQDEVRKCMEINTINGIVINRTRKNNRHILELMRGGIINAGLYDSQGETRTTRGSKSISEA